MMRVILDPEILEIFDPKDREAIHARITALKRVFSSPCARNQVAFIEASVWESLAAVIRRLPLGFGFWAQHLEPLVDWSGVANDVEPARIVGTPRPELQESWLRALALAIAPEPDAWRTPVVMVRDERRSSWPSGDDIQLDISGQSHERVLTGLDYDAHPKLPFYFDPWLHRGPYDPKVLAQLKPPNHPCILPKPNCITTGLPIDRWCEELRQVHSWRSDDGKTARYSFLPPDDWDPCSIPQAEWRRGHIFQTKQKGTKVGPMDRDGRVWHWDVLERHWDVQCAEPNDDHYDRISHTGRRIGD